MAYNRLLAESMSLSNRQPADNGSMDIILNRR